jgi:hypothetical protein
VQILKRLNEEKKKKNQWIAEDLIFEKELLWE